MPPHASTGLRPLVVVLIASALVACGGRVSPVDGLEGDDDTGGVPLDGSVDDSLVVGRDTGPTRDSSVIGSDGGAFDSGVIGADSSIRDSGSIGSDVAPIDSGVRDSGVIGSDVSPVDTSVPDTRDTGVIGSDGGTVGPSVADCDRIAKAACTSATKTCCEGRGFVYDDVGCEDVANTWCDDGRDGVSAGKTTYDPTFLAACADAWTKLTTTCSVPLLDYVKTYVPCSQMLNGKTAPGGTCARSTECYAPAGYSAFCDDSGTTRRCRAYAIVGAGAFCNYYGSTIRYCDSGLYCDYSGGPTVCRPITPKGGACFGIDDTSCGFGNTCKAGVCAAGTPQGGSCVRDLECASWSCTASKCTDPNAELASALFCSGV